jgi:hypothetical protein
VPTTAPRVPSIAARARRRPGHRGPGAGRRAADPGPTATARTRPGAFSAPRSPTTPWRSAGRPVPWRQAHLWPGSPAQLEARPGSAARGRVQAAPTTATGACAHRPSTAERPADRRAPSWSSRTARRRRPRLPPGFHLFRRRLHPRTLQAVPPMGDGPADGRHADPSDQLAWRCPEGQTDPPRAGTRPRSAHGCRRSRCSGAAGSATAGR